jgi:hypothetical protein
MWYGWFACGFLSCPWVLFGLFVLWETVANWLDDSKGGK